MRLRRLALSQTFSITVDNKYEAVIEIPASWDIRQRNVIKLVHYFRQKNKQKPRFPPMSNNI